MNDAIIAFAFGAGFFVVVGVNLLLADVFATHRQRVQTSVEDRLRTRQRDKVRAEVAQSDVYGKAVEESAASGMSVSPSGGLSHYLCEAGMLIGPAQLVMFVLVVGAIAAAVMFAISAKWLLALLAGAVVGLLPILAVMAIHRRRSEKLLSQLPDAFDLMARTLRAGQTLSHALQAVAEEFTAPIATEFGLCYDQQDLGLSTEAAMRDLVRRTGVLELRIFVLAVMIHRQTGGNLAELLEKLSGVIRARYRIRGAIKSLTAEGRLQGIILLALPPVMLFLMLLMNRSYTLVLFQYPIILVVMFVSMVIGGLWIRKIVNFDF